MYLRRNSICTLLFALFFAGYLLSASTLSRAQSSHIIEVQPASGPAGTTVVIRDVSGTNAGKLCSVSGPAGIQTIGSMQRRGISYVVPPDASAGAIFSFSCAGSAPNDMTNTVTFTVVLVLTVLDSDGDGVPDGQDNCPNDSGPVENRGCPTPVDTDGDGLADSVDACPALPGPRETTGCPVSPVPADGDGDGVPDGADACPALAGIAENNGCPIPPSPTSVSLPPLPADGACVIATADAIPVNIRQEPLADAAIVGLLDPALTYTVIGRNADSSRFQVAINGVAAGWVAASVTRIGGDCSGLPQTDGSAADLGVPAAAPEGGRFFEGIASRIGQGSVDVAPLTQNCPDLAPAVESLPTFLALYVIGEPDPCAAAQAELDGLFFAGAQQTSFDDVFEACHALLDFDFYLYFFEEFMDRLQEYAPDTWQVVNDLLPTDTPCSFIYDLMDRGLLPDEIPDAHVAPFTVAYCMFGDMTQTWFDKTVGFMNFIGFRRDSIEQLESEDTNVDDACEMVAFIRTLGTIYPSNVQLYQFLHNICLREPALAAREALYEPVREALDASAGLDNCGGTDDLVYYPLPEDLQPLLPSVAQGDDCIGNFRLLATHNQTLGLEMLYRMLISPDACQLAWEYSRDGYVSQISGLPAPDCIQGDTLLLTGTLNQATVLNQQSSWRSKIMVLDRPFEEVCDWITLPGEGESFAPQPTSILGSDDIAVVPTATPLGLVALPTVTPPEFTLNLTPNAGEPAAEEPEVPATDVPPLVEPTVIEATVVPPASEQGGGFNEISVDDTAGAEEAPGPEFSGVQAIFWASNAQDTSTGVYVVTDLQHAARDASAAPYPLRFDIALAEAYPVSLSPDGQSFTYFTTESNAADPQIRRVAVALEPSTASGEYEQVSLVYHQITWICSADGSYTVPPPSEGSVILNFAAGLTPAPYPPASLEGDQVLVFYLGGIPSIYRLSLNAASDVVVPELLVENAEAPSVSSNGRFIAFERVDASGRNIYVMATNSGEIRSITQEQGVECFEPKFASDSLTLFFTCQADEARGIFRYGITGVSEIQVGIPNADNFSPSPLSGYTTFDDGTTIYISRDDGTQVVPLFQLEGLNASNLMWSRSDPEVRALTTP